MCGSLGKVRPFFGNFAVLVRAYAYIMRMGRNGLKEASETRETLDLYIDTLKNIAGDNPMLVRSAPHNTSARRIDEVYATKEAILSWRALRKKEKEKERGASAEKDKGDCTLCRSIVGDMDSLKKRIGKSVD